MKSKAAVIALTLAMNVAGGLIQFEIFSAGSLGFKICGLAGFVLSNAIALFGAPVMKPAAAKGDKQ